MKQSFGPTVKDGFTRLHVRYNHLGIYDDHGDFALLIKQHDAGDCDTIPWPLREKDIDNLASALYDSGEMGYLTEKSYSDRLVYLPDDTMFDFEAAWVCM